MRSTWVKVKLVQSCSPRRSQSVFVFVSSDQQEAVCLSAGAPVSVPCPPLTGEDVIFNLLQDQHLIHNCTCHDSEVSQCQTQIQMDTGVELKQLNGSFSFSLSGDAAGRRGLYSCEGQVTFPPPYKKVQSSLKVLVLGQGTEDDELKRARAKWKIIWVVGDSVRDLRNLKSKWKRMETFLINS